MTQIVTVIIHVITLSMQHAVYYSIQKGKWYQPILNKRGLTPELKPSLFPPYTQKCFFKVAPCYQFRGLRVPWLAESKEIGITSQGTLRIPVSIVRPDIVVSLQWVLDHTHLSFLLGHYWQEIKRTQTSEVGPYLEWPSWAAQVKTYIQTSFSALCSLSPGAAQLPEKSPTSYPCVLYISKMG